MLGDNSRADDDQERKRYKSPPPPVAPDDDEDEFEDDGIEEEEKEKVQEEEEKENNKEEEEEEEEEAENEDEEKTSPKETKVVPKLVHSVSSFFLVKNLEKSNIRECPSSPKKMKATASLAETMIKTELELKQQGGSKHTMTHFPNCMCQTPCRWRLSYLMMTKKRRTRTS